MEARWDVSMRVKDTATRIEMINWLSPYTNPITSWGISSPCLDCYEPRTPPWNGPVKWKARHLGSPTHSSGGCAFRVLNVTRMAPSQVVVVSRGNISVLYGSTYTDNYKYMHWDGKRVRVRIVPAHNDGQPEEVTSAVRSRLVDQMVGMAHLLFGGLQLSNPLGF